MNQLSEGIADIGTYDRFIDIAKNYDYAEENPEESTYLPSTEN